MSSSSQTPIQENLITKNKEYAESFTQGHLALPPAKKYAVGIYFPLQLIPYEIYIMHSWLRKVTCMDARIDPASAFGITLGDAQ